MSGEGGVGGEKLIFQERHENKVHIQAEEEHSGRTEASKTTFDEQKMAVVSENDITRRWKITSNWTEGCTGNKEYKWPTLEWMAIVQLEKVRDDR